MEKQSIHTEELDELFGKGNYRIVKDTQGLSLMNSRKMEELFKAGKTHLEHVFFFLKEMVETASI